MIRDDDAYGINDFCTNSFRFFRSCNDFRDTYDGWLVITI